MHYLLVLSGFSWVHFWVTVNWTCSCLTTSFAWMKESKTPAGSRAPQKSVNLFVWVRNRFSNQIFGYSVLKCYWFLFLSPDEIPFGWNHKACFQCFCICPTCEVPGQDVGTQTRRHVGNERITTHTHTQSPMICSHRKNIIFGKEQFPQLSLVQKKINIILNQQAAAIFPFSSLFSHAHESKITGMNLNSTTSDCSLYLIF